MPAFLALIPVLFPAVASSAPAVAPAPAAPLDGALCLSVAATSGPVHGALSDKGDEDSALIAGLAKRGLHDLVVKEGREFLAEFASHRKAPVVRYRLADALFEVGKTAEAIAEYKRLDQIAGFEQAIEVKFRLGQLELDQGDHAAAAIYLNAVRTSDAAYLRVPATFLLAEALFKGDKFEPAAAAYAAVLESGDEAAEYVRDAGYGLTWSYWKAGNRPKTIESADTFLRRHRDDPQFGEIAFLAGEAHLEEKRPIEAIKCYDYVTSGDYVEAAMRGAAFAEAEQSDHEKSAERFGAYLEKFPKGRFAAEAALQRGVQLVRAGAFGAAVQALSTAPAADDAQTCYWRSIALAGANEHQRSYEAAARGLQKSPDETLAVQLRIAAGDALFELGRAEDAAALYEQSGSAYALHAAAVARLNAGDAEDAERLARTLLTGAAREPGSDFRAEAHLTRAEALFRLERYGEAEPVLRRLLAEAQPATAANGATTPAVTPIEPPLAARAVARLAWCRWYGDDAAEAATYFEAVAGSPAADAAAKAESRFMLGRAALSAGEVDRAQAAFQSYLAENKQGSFAAEALLRLARLTPGQPGAALYERLVAEHAQSPLAAAGLAELAERRSEAADHAGAAKAYAALVERFPNDPLARNGRYGLGFARYQTGDMAGASEPLWGVARDEAADDSLRNAALELLVWVEAAGEDATKSAQAFRAFAARSADEDRVLAAARVVDGALAVEGNLEARAELWSSIKTKLKGAEAASAARVEAGFIALDRGSPDVAAREAIAAQQLSPESPDAAELFFFVAETYFDAGDDERAAPLYVAAAEHGSAEVAENSLYKAGFAELRRGQNGPSAKAFAALVERFPNGKLAPESMFLAGEALYRADDTEAAATWLRRMVAEAPAHPARPKALFRLGLAEGKLERWRASADALAELVAKQPDFASATEAELWRGRALSRLGERRAARQALSKVVENDKGILAAQSRIELGRLFEDEKDDESAIAEYLKVAVLYGHAEECSEALVRAGDVLKRQGQPERANERYQEVVDDYPKTEWAAEAKQRLAGDGSIR